MKNLTYILTQGQVNYRKASIRTTVSERIIHGKARPRKGMLRTGSLANTGAHTKRKANQHGCLPRLLGDVDKGIEMV
jgi:hypothetical protein